MRSTGLPLVILKILLISSIIGINILKIRTLKSVGGGRSTIAVEAIAVETIAVEVIAVEAITSCADPGGGVNQRSLLR